jgi:hypothetical protein
MLKLKMVGLFAAFGLFGPLFRLSASAVVDSFDVIYIVQSITILVWPPQVLGVMERSLGTAGVAALTIGLNVVLFALLGVSAVLAWRWSLLLGAVHAIVLALVVVWANVWTGLDPWWAVASALVFYSMPFAILWRGRPILEAPHNNEYLDSSVKG